MNLNEQTLSLVVLAFVPLVFLLYLLPSIIAFRRLHPNRWLILAMNVMLGATGIGWAVALVWALNAACFGASGQGSPLHLFAANSPSPNIGQRDTMNVSRDSAVCEVHATLIEIERLARLRSEGHLSDQEFAALKADVLGNLRTSMPAG